MLSRKTLITTLLLSLSTSCLTAQTESLDLDDLHGNWHLRTMDGKDVREARAILDFDPKHMKINGFDGCNPVLGELKRSSDTHIFSTLSATDNECRESIHSYVRTRLHRTMQEGFTVTKATQNGIDGITIKSSEHELFFKKMGQKQEKKWFDVKGLL
jgi:heat shock protein HslJ